MKKYLFADKLWFSLYFITSVIIGLIVPLSAFIMQYVIDSIEKKSIQDLIYAVCWAFGYIMLLILVEFLDSRCRAKYLKNTVCHLRNDVFSNLINRNMRSFSQNNSATYISILNNDISMIENCYFDNMFIMIKALSMGIFAILTIASFNLLITTLVIVISFLPLLIPTLMGKKLSQNQEKYSRGLAKYNEKIKDFLSGFEVIKAFHIENNIINNHNKTCEQTGESKRRSDALGGLVNALGNASGYCLIEIIFITSAFMVVLGKLTLGTMTAITQLSNSVINPILMITDVISKNNSVKQIKQKLIELIDFKDYCEKGVDINHFLNSIEIKELKFKFENEGNIIINNINLTFVKGKKYAIVGSSGSGKSTLLKLILQYYTSYEGKILIDDIDISTINTDSLYTTISMIHQNIFMFDDTLEKNITLYNDYSHEDILKCINKSGLSEFVNTLKNGINTKIEENGNNLSGGEKQRVAIARTLIKDTNIVLIDEATSSLDNQTAYDIEKSIIEMENLTAIIVTHKYNQDLLQKYDEVIVLNQGEVCEQGTYNDLMERKGYFYHLYNPSI